MTETEKKETVKHFEKNVFTSKKSVLVFIVEAMLFALALMALLWQENLGWPLAAFMVAIVFSMGFILLVYIGRQSMIDAYTRGVALTGNPPKTFMNKFTDGLFSTRKEEEEDVESINDSE